MDSFQKGDSKTKSEEEESYEPVGQVTGTRQKNIQIDKSLERRDADRSRNTTETQKTGWLRSRQGYRGPRSVHPEDTDAHYFGSSEFPDEMFMNILEARKKRVLTKKEREDKTKRFTKTNNQKWFAGANADDALGAPEEPTTSHTAHFETVAKLLTDYNISLPSVSAPLTLSDLDDGNVDKKSGTSGDLPVERQSTGGIFTSQSDDMSGLGDHPSTSNVSEID